MAEDIGSWMGHKFRSPEGKIGKVIRDVNGLYRRLTVQFEDGSDEEVWLANMGPNPTRSQKWSWLFTHEQKQEWIEFGQ